MTNDIFGCKTCWPDQANDAWSSFKSLNLTKELVDESHFKIKVHACPQCQQAFVSVFSERIDWIDGEDPQDRQIMPLTPQEQQAVIGAENEDVVYQISPQRKVLHWEFPKGSDSIARWAVGLQRVPHD